MPSYTLHLGDCLEVMPGIADGSVDAIIADWPYGTTACKWDSVIPLEPLWKECKRAIKPGGAIVLFGKQPFTSTLVMSNPKWFRCSWVWDKGRGVGHLVVKYVPMQRTEDVLVFGKSSVTYNPQMAKREKPYFSHATVSQWAGKKQYTRDGYKGKWVTEKHPTNIIFCPWSPTKTLHPTQKPVALMEYLIKTYTNPGDLVLDNTFGSCSTGEACLRTGRRFIGIEKDPGYFEIGKERMERVEEELKRQPYLIEAVS